MLGLRVVAREHSIRGYNMKQEYDFTLGVRGKYLKRFQEGSNIVVLDPEVANVFQDSEAVNDALRSLIQLAYKNKSLLKMKKTSRKA